MLGSLSSISPSRAPQSRTIAQPMSAGTIVIANIHQATLALFDELDDGDDEDEHRGADSQSEQRRPGHGGEDSQLRPVPQTSRQ